MIRILINYSACKVKDSFQSNINVKRMAIMRKLIKRTIEYSRHEDISTTLCSGKKLTHKLITHGFSKAVHFQKRGQYAQESIASPWGLYYINPVRIKYTISQPDLRNNLTLVPYGGIRSGDWDAKKSKFEDHYVYCSFVERFLNGTPWTETEYYRIQIERGRDKQEMLRQLKHYEDIYNIIQEDGYRSQQELNPQKLPCPEAHEVTVHIGRNGEYIRHDGRHRLAIAKILDLERIPVRVCLRHSEWQRVRDMIVSEGRVPHDVGDHPDLKDLRSTDT